MNPHSEATPNNEVREGRMAHLLWRMLLLILGLVATVGGCQHRPAFTFVPVEGTITKAGQPLADVQVVFYGDPDAGTLGPRASGFTDEAGHYRLHGDLIRGDRTGPQDGAAMGKHRVCVLDPLAKSETPEDKRRVPAKYGSIQETPLRAEVQSEPLVFDIALP